MGTRLLAVVAVLVGCGDNIRPGGNGPPGDGNDPRIDAAVGDASPDAPTLRGMYELDEPIIAATGTNATDPSVAFDGTSYLVVWADARDNIAYDIWGTRVGLDGTILDPQGMQIAADVGADARPVVVHDGTRYVVVWEQRQAGQSDLQAAAIASSGSITRLPAITATATNDTQPAIASGAAGELLVVWRAADQIMTAHITGDTVAPAVGITSLFPASSPKVAADNNGNYLVTFVEVTPATKDDIRGQRVAADGSLTGIPFAIDSGNAPSRSPAIAFDGTNFIVAWSGYFPGIEIYAARVSRAGSVLDTHKEGTRTVGGTIISNALDYQEAPAISCGPDDCLIAWQDKRAAGVTVYDLYAQRVAHDLTLLGDELLVVDAPMIQWQVQLAHGPDGYYCVWRDAIAGGNASLRVSGTRISSTGMISDPAGGVVISRGYNLQVAPLVVQVLGKWFVGWQDSRDLLGDDIHVSAVDDDGAPTASIDFPGRYQQQQLDVASFGDRLLYVWSDHRSGRDFEIYAARFDPSSNVFIDSSGLAVSGNLTIQNALPRVAASATEALVVWISKSTATARSINAAYMGVDGAVGQPFEITVGNSVHSTQAVAYDPADDVYIVVWAEGAADVLNLRATRVSRAGVVLDPGGVPITTGTQGRRHVARLAFRDGAGLLAYQDDATGTPYIYAARVHAAGSLVFDAPFAVGDATDPEGGPLIAKSDAGFVVAWSRLPLAGGGDFRARIVPFAGAPGAPFVISDNLGGASIAVKGNRLIVAHTVRRADLHTTRVAARAFDLP